MEIFQRIAYWFAVLIVATFPPAMVYWFIIHPFTGFWRRLGKTSTFTLVGLVCVALAIAIGMQHERILAVHWGYHWPMIFAGLVLYVLGAWIERQIRKQLKFRILVGSPQLDADQPGELLTAGIYARCRNPRYVNIVVATFGWALILNYPAIYVVVLICVPMLYAIVLLEERELRERFGEPYEQYCREVPRFVPRLRT